MVKTAKSRVLQKIRYKKSGWVFSAVDFLPDLKRWEIDQSFIALEKDGIIVRLLPGLYYCPEYSRLLKENVAPNMQNVADALARKYNWNIFPEGNTALNYLGLSTQLVSKYIYISSGGPRKYKIGNTVLEFRHRVLTESLIKDKNTMLVIQAIKALGQIHADANFTKQLSSRFSRSEWQSIKKHAQKITGWVYEIITKIAEK